MSGAPRHFCLCPPSHLFGKSWEMTESPIATPELQRLLGTLGYELVDLKCGGSAAAPVLSVRIDRAGGAARGEGVTTEDCARVSRSLDEALDEAGVDSSRWRVDVSSPGIERPVRFAEHWKRYTGHQVRIRAPGIVGRQVATIRGISDADVVAVEVDGREHFVPREAVRDATLVVDWSAIG